MDLVDYLRVLFFASFLSLLEENMKKFVHPAWRSFASSQTTLTREKRYVPLDVGSFECFNIQINIAFKKPGIIFVTSKYIQLCFAIHFMNIKAYPNPCNRGCATVSCQGDDSQLL